MGDRSYLAGMMKMGRPLFFSDMCAAVASFCYQSIVDCML